MEKEFKASTKLYKRKTFKKRQPAIDVNLMASLMTKSIE